jgi:hypothetical protein
MSYPKDVLETKGNLLKESSASSSFAPNLTDNISHSHYYDKTKIILDARKAFDGLIPYSGLGANSTNDYFSSIDFIGGGKLKADEEDYSDVDLSLTIESVIYMYGNI